MRFGVAGAVGAVALLVAGGEILARHGLGLGTPPLSVAHPEIEYLFRPDQEVMRFHNRHRYNEVGMRSGPVPRDEGVPVILVIGDSVVNGGSETDQAELATEILRRELSGDRGEVFVGNVSAGSWGPANQLAYLREFGQFGAQGAVLVLSSHDASDVPGFGPLDPGTHPTERPLLALWEGVTRYLPRYLPDFGAAEAAAEPPPPPGAALGDLAALVEEVRGAGRPLCAVHHLSRAELEEGLTEDGSRLRAALEAADVPVVTDGPAFRAALEAGGAPFRDGIHPSAEGQVLLAGAIRDCLGRIGLAGPA